MLGRLYLIRHGQTLWNTQMRLQGHKDSPLTALGERQAAAVRQALLNINLDHLYTSTSGRAFHTSQLITAGRPVSVSASDELREIALGRWEGQTKDRVKEKYPQAAKHFWEEPHLFEAHSSKGETYLEARERLVKKILEIMEKHPGKEVAVVTHGVAIQLILSHFLGLGLQDLRSRKFVHQASISLLEFEDGAVKVLYENKTDHLAHLESAETQIV